MSEKEMGHQKENRRTSRTLLNLRSKKQPSKRPPSPLAHSAEGTEAAGGGRRRGGRPGRRRGSGETQLAAGETKGGPEAAPLSIET